MRRDQRQVAPSYTRTSTHAYPHPHTHDHIHTRTSTHVNPHTYIHTSTSTHIHPHIHHTYTPHTYIHVHLPHIHLNRMCTPIACVHPSHMYTHRMCTSIMCVHAIGSPGKRSPWRCRSVYVSIKSGTSPRTCTPADLADMASAVLTSSAYQSIKSTYIHICIRTQAKLCTFVYADSDILSCPCTAISLTLLAAENRSGGR